MQVWFSIWNWITYMTIMKMKSEQTYETKYLHTTFEYSTIICSLHCQISNVINVIKCGGGGGGVGGGGWVHLPYSIVYVYIAIIDRIQAP